MQPLSQTYLTVDIKLIRSKNTAFYKNHIKGEISMAEKKVKRQARPKKTATDTKKKTVPSKKTTVAKKTIKKETIVKKNPTAILQKDKNTWMLSTAVLAILLIASLFTGGFDFNRNDQNAEIACIDTLLDSAIASETKTALTTAKEELVSALAAEEKEIPTNTVDDSDKPVTLDMYVMSQCPYGVQAEDGAIPAVQRLIDSVDYNIYFIVNENGDGTFSSLHGQPEVDENLRQICINEKYPDQFLNYLTCLNKNYRTAESAWTACATAYNIDTDEISACQTGDEGYALLSESAKKAKSVGASGSPTIFINDRPYQQGRDTQSFTRAICQLAPENPACDSIPACSADADCTKTGSIGKCIDANTENAKCEYTQPPVVNIKVLDVLGCFRRVLLHLLHVLQYPGPVLVPQCSGLFHRFLQAQRHRKPVTQLSFSAACVQHSYELVRVNAPSVEPEPVRDQLVNGLNSRALLEKVHCQDRGQSSFLAVLQVLYLRGLVDSQFFHELVYRPLVAAQSPEVRLRVHHQ